MTKVRENIQLKDLNTFAVQAKAEYFVDIESAQELTEILEQNDFSDIHILGGGSNVLFKDDIEGLVIKNSIQDVGVIKENEQEVYIKVKSGENWDEFVQYCVENEYWGVENLGLIPGTLGGAILQNAGAYGVEIKDVVTEVEGIKLDSLKNFSFSNSKCNFSYRDSIFKQNENKFFITSATFKLDKKGSPNLEYGSIKKELNKKNIKKPAIEDMYNTVCEIRKNKLPDWKKIGTAGSFFKNPFTNKVRLQELKNNHPDIPAYDTNEGIKLSAGWLIENTNVEPNKFPEVDLYPNHSLIIINSGHAKGKTIYDFSEHIRKKVLNKFGINLEREVRMW